MGTAITDREVRDQVLLSLSGWETEYDTDAVVRDIIAAYGLVDINTVDHDAYWGIVERHAVPVLVA